MAGIVSGGDGCDGGRPVLHVLAAGEMTPVEVIFPAVEVFQLMLAADARVPSATVWGG